MTGFVVIENTPGCLPESEPVECATLDEARVCADHERVVEVQEVP